MTISKPLSAIDRRRFLQTTILGAGAAAAGILISRPGDAAEEPVVNFYNWDTYIGETTLDDFRSESGITVKMSLFADNDELFAKMKEGNPGFDLIVPTNDYVARMIEAGMIVALDHSKIPNFKTNISPVFQDADFDPGRKYSMPYMWGTMGLGYRKSAFPNGIESWKTIFDSDEAAGRIALISESRTMLGITLKYLGYSMNSTSKAEIDEAAALLIKQKPNIKVIAEDNGQDLLLSGEVDVAVEWNGDIGQVMAEDDDVTYTIPKEGGLVWQDCLCIPKDAPHPNNAHAFINYILDAEAGAKIADYIQYGSPNDAARKLLGDDYNKNASIFPPEEVLAKCESSLYLGEDVQRLYDDAWTRVQAS